MRSSERTRNYDGPSEHSSVQLSNDLGPLSVRTFTIGDGFYVATSDGVYVFKAKKVKVTWRGRVAAWLRRVAIWIEPHLNK